MEAVDGNELFVPIPRARCCTRYRGVHTRVRDAIPYPESSANSYPHSHSGCFLGRFHFSMKVHSDRSSGYFSLALFLAPLVLSNNGRDPLSLKKTKHSFTAPDSMAAEQMFIVGTCGPLKELNWRLGPMNGENCFVGSAQQR